MKNKVVNEFQNWGDEYLVEFDIAVANLPSSSTSVFRFTSTNGNGLSDGDRIPALFILKDGIFHFVTSVNNNPEYQLNVAFELGKMYHVTILQQKNKEDGKHWYEILIDGESKLKIENIAPRSYTNVKLYASDSYFDPFITNVGSICNVNIQHQDKGLCGLFLCKTNSCTIISSLSIFVQKYLHKCKDTLSNKKVSSHLRRPFWTWSEDT